MRVIAMRFSMLAKNERVLVRSAAVLLLAGMATGCSSHVSRFASVDDIFTASTPNQRQIMNQNQPYPGDMQAAPLASAETAPVTRSTLTPVSSQPLPPPVTQPAAATASVAPASQPVMPAPARAAAPGPAPLASAAPKPEMQPSKAQVLSTPDGQVAMLPQPAKVTANQSASSAASGSASGTYTVQEGDTLTKISRKTGVSAAALQSANGLNDGVVRIGQTLKVPAGGTTAVAAATPEPVAVSAPAPAKAAAEAPKVATYTPPKSEKTIEQAEQVAAVAPDSTGIGKMRWPVRGRVISGYGKGGGKANDGIDIQVPQGTPVKAAENGVVIYAGDGLKEFGNTVLVRHENGLVTVYGHASELKVSRGQTVKRGQEIALSGMSGNTDSPRLHFEVRKNSTPVNPSTYLE